MAPTFDERAEWFDQHYASVRGRVRLRLVLERIDETFPSPPARVLDAGGGSGAFAIPLAERGYRVTLLDPSEAMLAIAERRARGDGVEVDLTRGSIRRAASLLEGDFDGICCHAVLMYLDDPLSALVTLRSLAAPGCALSLLEKNRGGLAMRPGLAGEYAEARRLLVDPVASGNLGIPNRARTFEAWRSLLARAGWRATSWVGIRLFSDKAPDELDEERFEGLLALEREAGRRTSYRSVARLIHISARAE